MLVAPFLSSQTPPFSLILGSRSPRRKALLESAGFFFKTLDAQTDETFPHDMQPSYVAEYLSCQKAEALNHELSSDSLLITADTIVVKDNQILNKAMDPDEAFQMLNMLNGTSHDVITGVSLTSMEKQLFFHEITKVYFCRSSPRELWYYIENYKPFDKAGAYGIQEWIGLMAVEKIEGCYYNVVGLPVARLYKELKNFLLPEEKR